MTVIKESILDLVRSKQAVTFAEIVRLPDTRGPYCLELGNFPNVVLWTGLSQEVIDALIELQREELIHKDLCNVLAYAIDGYILQMPLVKRPPAKGYSEPHWLPVVFNPGPSPHKKAAERKAARKAAAQRKAAKQAELEQF